MPRILNQGVISKTDDGEIFPSDKNNKTRKTTKKTAKNKLPSPIKFLTNTLEKCKICANNVDEHSIALECDKCKGWVHLDCSNMPSKEYEWIDANPTHTLKHFCKICEDELERDNSKDEKIAQQNLKIDQLTEVVKAIADQNNVILELLKKATSDTDVQPAPTQRETVQTQIKEVLEQHQEKEEKQQNIIIFNIPESESIDNEEESEQDDIKKTVDILKFLGDSEASPSDIQITRMGKRRKEDSPRPRPVKVKLASIQKKEHVLKKVRNLKHYKTLVNIGISHDKTRKEIIEDKRLRAELKNKRETNLDQEYVIYNKQVVLKSDIPKIKNKKYSTDEASDTDTSKK